MWLPVRGLPFARFHFARTWQPPTGGLAVVGAARQGTGAVATRPRQPDESATPVGTLRVRSHSTDQRRRRARARISTTQRVVGYRPPAQTRVRPHLLPRTRLVPRGLAARAWRRRFAGTQGDAELRQRVWGLALPAIGEQVLAMGVGISDTFLSGHLSQAAITHLGYSRETAVAAVGAASTAVWVILTIFFAVNIGVTALVARATGARDGQLAQRSAGQGILLGLLSGLVMMALAVPLAGLIIRMMGITGEIAVLATHYIQIMSLAMPATGVASAANAAMRGASDARRPLTVMCVVNGLNVVASWTLMNGVPRLGIAPIGVIGSAIGAATGWILGCLLAIFFLRRHHPKAPRLVWSALRPNREVATRILRIGLPSGAELTVFQLGVLTFYRLVIGLGPAAYAANITINSVESLGSLPAFGFAVAATSLVGQALGASDPELAIRAAWASLRPCIVVTATMGALALLLPHLLLGMFVADPAVLSAGDIAMRFSLVIMPASAAASVFNGALRGAGDTKFPVLVRVTGTWILRVPLALFLIPIWALPGARLAMMVDFCTEAGLTYWRFRSGRWRSMRV